MKLAQYLSSTGNTPATFADQLGVARVTVERYLDGTRRPQWDVLVKIMDVTKGKVTANDFLYPPQKSEARSVA